MAHGDVGVVHALEGLPVLYPAPDLGLVSVADHLVDDDDGEADHDGDGEGEDDGAEGAVWHAAHPGDGVQAGGGGDAQGPSADLAQDALPDVKRNEDIFC